MSNSSFPPPYFCLLVILTLSSLSHSLLYQGCSNNEQLCDPEEVCLPDGLFGQCYSEASPVTPLILEKPLTRNQQQLLRYELARLASNKLDWSDGRSQCVLAYFKLSIAYELDYDTEFCVVRNANNIWALVEKVQGMLSNDEQLQLGGLQVAEEEIPFTEELPMNAQEALIVDENTGVAVPVILMEEDVLEDDNAIDEAQPVVMQENTEDNNKKNQTNTKPQKNTEKRSTEEKAATAKSNGNQMPPQSTQTAVEQLSIEDLDQLIDELRQSLDLGDIQQISAPEMEEPVPLTSESNGQQMLLKKDKEKFDNSDLGLANTVHKIVKGDIQRVEGNRVYLKVAKTKLTEEELYKLINYLDIKIASPNNLYFDEFQYENGQLSFRISRLDAFRKKNAKRVESAGGVAQAVYKRRKDIQTLSGVQVDETGIGSGSDVVPVERSGRDTLFFPIIAICAFTITSLLTVLAVQFVKNRRRSSFKYDIPPMVDGMENGKASTLYEDLCRQRMSIQEVTPGNRGTASKTSSTSSRPDESVLQSCALDISSGHVILSFLQEYLEHPEKITEQWSSLSDYTNNNGQTRIALKDENHEKNYDSSVVPYDDSLIVLQNTDDLTNTSGYINASGIHDSDMRQVAYIATQSPMDNTVTEFWQMVWEQGVALIVNLCDQTDLDEGRSSRYWPEEGCVAHGNFEIHLVSEHIWSEDYVVRSFYLKNRTTNETRTVTQFHFLTWPENGCPASNKSLVEFRRKVNKSYRGRASPVLVHCTNGAGRTGTYCLIDIVANRICKGVKELNIAGSLEHLRDQRMGMVSNAEQYKMVFSCVADEVTSLLKTLPQ
jgi:protein tyrosine phosphatase